MHDYQAEWLTYEETDDERYMRTVGFDQGTDVIPPIPELVLYEGAYARLQATAEAAL